MLKINQIFFIFFNLIIISFILILINYQEQKNTNFLEKEIKEIEKLIKNINDINKIKKEYQISLLNDLGIIINNNMPKSFNEKKLKKTYEIESVKSLSLTKKIKIDNQEYYLKLSIVLRDNYKFWLISLFILLGLNFLFSLFIKRKIKSELVKIDNFSISIIDKKYDKTYESKIFFEFNYIFKILNKISKILSKDELKKRKDIFKLKLNHKQRDGIISAISHEFKNPISIIMGYTQTIMDENLDKTTRNKFLSKIQNHSKKINLMIDKFSIISKLEDNKIKLDIENFDLFELSINIKNSLKEKYKDRNIKLIGSKNIIKADKLLMELVVSNIIDNALKYSKKDIIVKLENNIFKVLDTGLGIDKKEKENISKKFYRIHKNKWDNSMGLGLFIVKNILALHKIELKLKSKLKKGSCFYFNFNKLK